MKKIKCIILFLFFVISSNSYAAKPNKDNCWWQKAICYEIYIRSFNDSNGDGIGDINGIIEKLPYLRDLGIDVIWITPFYPSPDVDMGYDISDYTNVDSKYGTLFDFDNLIKKANELEIKILLDMVFSHTSDQHPWFKSGRISRNSLYHNYYVFENPKDKGEVPNNWKSYFSGSAWEFNAPTKEYYLHIFAKEQPYLNWKNPKVRRELQKVAKFWLDRGCGGIRFDVISLIALPPLKDSSNMWGKMPEAKIYLQELNKEVLSKYDILTVGEMPGVDYSTASDYVASPNAPLKTIFQLDIMSLGCKNWNKFSPTAYDLLKFKAIYQNWYNSLYGKGWNSVVLGNHDQARVVSRWGDDKKYWKESAKMLATFLLSQWGTPYIYQGDEIGMTNCHFTPSEFKDIEEINYYKSQLASGKKEEDFLPGLLARCRDNARTPMQWNNNKNAGFTTADSPWLKVNPNYKNINVLSEEKEKDSVLNYYKKMITLRKNNPALIYGSMKQLSPTNKKVFAYIRSYQNEDLLVVCNFSDSNVIFDTKMPNLHNLKVLIYNYTSLPDVENSVIYLRPYEAIILIVNKVVL